MVLVGNKLDREDEREVEYAEGSRWAQENGKQSFHLANFHRLTCDLCTGLLFAEVSSLTGENVVVPFLLAARNILSSIDSGALDPDAGGTGVSYGERQLRAVGSSSRLSAVFGVPGRRKRRKSVSIGDMVGAGRSCSC